MAGRRCVKNCDGHIIFRKVKHLCHQPACVQRHGFSGFEENLQSVLFLHTLYAAFKARDVVIVTGDVMSAAEVYPLHFRQYIAEFLLYGIECGLQIVGVLLAESVKVKAAYTVKVVFTEVPACDAKS